MRWMTLLLILSGLWLPCHAQNAYVEIGGVAVTRGMKKEDVVSAFLPHLVQCQKTEGAEDDEEACIIGSASVLPGQGGTARFGGEGEIVFRDGRVWSATRNLRSSDSAEAYELFLSLDRVMTQLTGGDDTCVQISRFTNPMQQIHMLLVFPQKKVEIMTASRGEFQGVFLRESLRINPVPGSHKTSKLNSEPGHCVFVE